MTVSANPPKADMPANATRAYDLATDNGWRVSSQFTDDPITVALKFRRETADAPRVAALWNGGRYWFGLSQNGFRLGYRDLMAVLVDPGVLLDFDPEDPFGTQEGPS